MKSVDEVLARIDSTVRSFEGTPDAVTFPLQAIVGTDWGFGIHCAKGVWVAECDPKIAQQVLEECSKINQEQVK